MNTQRARRAKLNILVSLAGQFVTLICGLIVPRLMIGHFGSTAYGATASIAQFLAYITLLEAGIGGVARAALYKPLAENDHHEISAVVSEIRRFFRVIGIVFAVYVVILTCSYHSLAHVRIFDWTTTAMLVVVISISTFAQYFIGISNTILLQAAQRTYITKLVSISATCLNTVAIVILVRMNCSLVVVKLVSSIVFALRPFVLWWYVRKHFSLVPVKETNTRHLEQKWNALGQHIAYFLHSNTDIAVLTVLVNLASVSVYSVYQMIVSEIQNFSASFSTGMESVFGDMLAKREDDLLQRTFGYYETLISFISVILFSVTAAMIIPFVKLYTAKITDVNYIHPTFALLLILASMLYCMRMPYHTMVMAAGHFRQTQKAAYGEAIINIVSSVLLVFRFGLAGVAAGTVAATLFRFCFYAFYLSKNIFNRPLAKFLKRMAVNFGTFSLIFVLGNWFISHVGIHSYFDWILYAAVVTVFSAAAVIAETMIFYRQDAGPVIRKILRK